MFSARTDSQNGASPMKIEKRASVAVAEGTNRQFFIAFIAERRKIISLINEKKPFFSYFVCVKNGFYSRRSVNPCDRIE